MFRYRLLILNGILLATLLAGQWGRRIESAGIPQTDFLRPLNLPFRDWTTSEGDISPADRQILQPDAILLRQYRSAGGEEADLAVIAGHRKCSLHTPGFCMTGEGWNTISQTDATIALADRKISAIRMLMEKEGHQLLATYFFTNGEYSTRSLIQFDAIQMMLRFRSRIPLGALIRIIVPIQQDRTDAETLSAEFAQAILPPILAQLRQVRLQL